MMRCTHVPCGGVLGQKTTLQANDVAGNLCRASSYFLHPAYTDQNNKNKLGAQDFKLAPPGLQREHSVTAPWFQDTSLTMMSIAVRTKRYAKGLEY